MGDMLWAALVFVGQVVGGLLLGVAGVAFAAWLFWMWLNDWDPPARRPRTATAYQPHDGDQYLPLGRNDRPDLSTMTLGDAHEIMDAVRYDGAYPTDAYGQAVLDRAQSIVRAHHGQ